jgi:hypothetical protein
MTIVLKNARPLLTLVKACARINPVRKANPALPRLYSAEIRQLK